MMHRDVDSPLGTLRLSVRDGALVAVEIFRKGKKSPDAPDAPDVAAGRGDRALLDKAQAALRRYFEAGAPLPDLPLRPQTGTEFQRAVWRVMRGIPRGQSLSYGEVAERVGRPGGARAVGGACGANPIPLFQPCHRVLAKGGIGGFTGGLPIKKALLALEGITVPSSLPKRPRAA